MRLFAEIKKIDREQRMVFGYASTEALDNQGEIVRKEAIEAALPDYMRFANIREMHEPSAIGIAKEAAIDDKGLHIAARIVDDEAWKKVTEGVYKGFSIGGKVTARDSVAKHVITGVELMEISLVDRPANPDAVIELYKAARSQPTQIWDCGTAGHHHLTKAQASKCMSEIGARKAAAKTATPSLTKGLDEVKSLAGILSDIDDLQASAAAEESEEGDGSKLPAKLKAWLDEGAALLTAMVAEETAELTGGGEAPAMAGKAAAAKTSLAKVGARHSKADLQRVQRVHNTAVALGASCYGAAKHESAGDLAKMLAERDGAMRDIVDPLAKSVADLSRRLAALEAQPLPAKGIAKAIAIGKEQDAGGAATQGESIDGFLARLAGMSAEKRAHELTKLALRLPTTIAR